MRLDPRPTVPSLLPAFRSYAGGSLRPFLRCGKVTLERIAECAELAAERRDREGQDLVRALLRLSADQRRRLRKLLTASKFVS